MLISTWAANSPTAVGQLLAVSPLIPFLTSVIGSNEHDELERLVQGLCAFLLGLCLVYNDNSVKANNEEELFQLIEKRIGFEVRNDIDLSNIFLTILLTFLHN